MNSSEDNGKPAIPEYSHYAGLRESSVWWREALSKLRGRDLVIVGIIVITSITLQLEPVWPAYLLSALANLLLFALGWRISE